MTTFHFITIFPDAFSYLNESILARAVKDKIIGFKFYNPRDFVPSKKKKVSKNDFPEYRRVDDKPYGGGPGMVMEAMPIIKAIEKALVGIRRKKTNKVKIVFLAPGAKQYDTEYAKTTAKKYTDIIFICGRYEGVDARVVKIFKAEGVSVGPFVVTGGELPAMIMTDCIARQLPGVLGSFDSLEETRTASHEVYTRPEVLEHKGKKYRVPKVLLGGNHKLIEEWRAGKKSV